MIINTRVNKMSSRTKNGGLKVGDRFTRESLENMGLKVPETNDKFTTCHDSQKNLVYTVDISGNPIEIVDRYSANEYGKGASD